MKSFQAWGVVSAFVLSGCLGSEVIDTRTSTTQPRFTVSSNPAQPRAPGSTGGSSAPSGSGAPGTDAAAPSGSTPPPVVVAGAGIVYSGPVTTLNVTVPQAAFQPLDPHSGCAVTRGGRAQCFGRSLGLESAAVNPAGWTTVSVVRSMGQHEARCRILRESASGASRVECAALRESAILSPSGVSGSNRLLSLDTWYPIVLPRNVEQLALGRDHACALLATGEVYCWGSNLDGRLGRPLAESWVPTPVQARYPVSMGGGGLTATAVAASDEATCVIRRPRPLQPGQDAFDADLPGVVHCFGRFRTDGNVAYQFHADLAVREYVPPASALTGSGSLAAPTRGSGFIQIAMDSGMGCALRSGSPGRVYCWEAIDQIPASGQPALKAMMPASRGAEIPSFSAVAVSNHLMCGIESGGLRVHCWGAGMAVRAVTGRDFVMTSPSNDRGYSPYSLSALPGLGSGETFLALGLASVSANSAASLSGRSMCLQTSQRRVHCYGISSSGRATALSATPVEIPLTAPLIDPGLVGTVGGLSFTP